MVAVVEEGEGGSQEEEGGVGGPPRPTLCPG